MIGIYKWGWGDGSENLAFWGWEEVYSGSESGAFVPIIVTGAPGSGTVVSDGAAAAVTVTDAVIKGLSDDGFKTKTSPQVITFKTIIPEEGIKSVKRTEIYAYTQAGFAPRPAGTREAPGKLGARSGGVKTSGRENKAKAVK